MVRRSILLLGVAGLACVNEPGPIGPGSPPPPLPPPPPTAVVRLKDMEIPNLPSPYYRFEYDSAGKVAFDACKATPEEPATGECEKPDASCTATVTELEACLADTTAGLEDLSEQVPSCAELTLDSVGMMPTTMEPAEPASCVTLDMKCPDSPMPVDPEMP